MNRAEREAQTGLVAGPAGDGCQGHAHFLALLTFLFGGRVAGQAWVGAVGDGGWLPPFDLWYSGLIPYPLLLPLQIGLLVVLVSCVVAISRGGGAFETPRPRLACGLRLFAVSYFAVMGARAIITWHVGDWRSCAIPVVFHWVLAAACWVCAASLSARPKEGPQ